VKRVTSRRGRGAIGSTWLALLCAGLFACATPRAPAEREPVDCRPDFPFQDGWLGGDAAYSVALPAQAASDERPTLWLFGDSFVSETPLPDRRGAHFVHNSIGLSHCGENGFEIEYYWGQKSKGEPSAFFDSDAGSPYWWLFDGFVHAGVLYVGLLEIEAAAPDPILKMPFRMTGMQLARIEKPNAPPLEWQPQIANLLRSDRAFPGAAMVIEGDYVYFFTSTALRSGRQPRLLLRMPLAALTTFPEDLSTHLETWVEGGRWKAGWQPDHALPVMHDNSSEMSVERHAASGKWIAIYGSPIQIDAGNAPGAPGDLSDEIFLRHANQLEGPWSERLVLYVMPEVEGGPDGEGDPNTICYAAKGHAAFARHGRLLFTYVCNLHSKAGDNPYVILQRLQMNMNLYRPVVVEEALPPVLRPESTRPLSDLLDRVAD